MLVCVYRTLTSRNNNRYLYNNINLILMYSIARELYVAGDVRQMVLDLLIWIRSYIDRTLSFRSSCCEGVCGSCAMLINNSNTLACIQPIWLIMSYIIVYPLPHFNVVRDLVVDLKHFYEQYTYINPFYYIYDISGFSDMEFSYFVLYFLRLRNSVLSYIYSCLDFKAQILFNYIHMLDLTLVWCQMGSIISDAALNHCFMDLFSRYGMLMYPLK